jgi:hypothetical protein
MVDSAILRLRSIDQGIDSNTITEEISFYRHWHAPSQPYAGGDSLATALHLGWIIGEEVLLRECWFAGSRCVRVYYFELKHEDARLVMPVIANPFVEHLIITYPLQVKLPITTIGLEKRPSGRLFRENE